MFAPSKSYVAEKMRSGCNRIKTKLMRGTSNEDHKGGQRRVTRVGRFNHRNVTSERLL